MTAHPSDSEVQRRAEPVLVTAAANILGIELSKQTLKLPGGASVQLDGCNLEERVACEAFAHHGALKSGQRRKLGNDILKLMLVERGIGGNWRKVLVVAEEAAYAWLSGSSWQAMAVREFGIELVHEPLDDVLSAEVLAAQGLQVMVNVPTRDE